MASEQELGKNFEGVRYFDDCACANLVVDVRSRREELKSPRALKRELRAGRGSETDTRCTSKSAPTLRVVGGTWTIPTTD